MAGSLHADAIAREAYLEQAVQCRLLLLWVGERLRQGKGCLVELHLYEASAVFQLRLHLTRTHTTNNNFQGPHLILLDQGEALTPEERRTAINGILVVGVDLSGLLFVDGHIPSFLQLRLPEVSVVVALDLLQAQDVRLVRQQLPQQVALAVVPVQGPGWAVVGEVRLSHRGGTVTPSIQAVMDVAAA